MTLTNHNWFVVAMGIVIVFVGLLCIVILCKIIGALCSVKSKKASTQSEATPTLNKPIENRQEIIAAISAAVAEELGKDISAIRILSFKKI